MEHVQCNVYSIQAQHTFLLSNPLKKSHDQDAQSKGKTTSATIPDTKAYVDARWLAAPVKLTTPLLPDPEEDPLDDPPEADPPEEEPPLL